MKVRVTNTKSGMFLTEWEDPDGDGLQRAWVTKEMILETLDDDGHFATVEQPERGVPYGADWKNILPEMNCTVVDLANELKRRGIWTIEDMRANPNIVRIALSNALGTGLSAILHAAAAYDASNGG